MVPTRDATFPHLWIYAEDAGELTGNLGGDVGTENAAVIDEVEGQIPSVSTGTWTSRAWSRRSGRISFEYGRFALTGK